MTRLTSDVSGLGPPVCTRCLVIGCLGVGDSWTCPRCHTSAYLNGSLFTYTQAYQKRIEVRTAIVEGRRKIGSDLLVRNAHTSIRPFMADGEEPNNYYRSWLEENIGRQGRDWDWELCGTDIDYLEIYFAKREHATLFELKWP